MAGTATGLDFGAVMAIAAQRGVDLDLLAEALPELETVILSGLAGETEEE